MVVDHTLPHGTATAVCKHGEVSTRTPDDFFEAALDLLADGGAPAVTVARLCTALGVTKGSFYHHFPGIPGFMDGLLAYWEQRGVDRAMQAMAATGPCGLFEVAKLAATWELHHEAESAIRALARTDERVAAVLERVDRWREDQLVAAFVLRGMDGDRAQVLARLGMAVLIGTQQREHPVDRRRLQQTLDEYQRWLEHVIATAGAPLAKT